MRILLWVVRALAILLLIRMILRSLFGSRPSAARTQGGPGPGGRPRAQERIGGELGSGEAVEYFCSPECRDAYAKR